AAARKLEETGPSFEAHLATACVKWWDWQFSSAVAEARAALKMRAAAKANLALGHLSLGWFLMQTGHPAQAREEYLTAERLSPADPIIQSHLGHPYVVEHKFDQALAQYQKSLELMPTHLLCRRGMAEVYEVVGDFMKAIDNHEAAELPDAADKEAVKR